MSDRVMSDRVMSDRVMGRAPMRGAVLAAGLGTRLRPLTERRPKPLVPVAGRPLLEWALLALAEAGVSEVGVNTHYLSGQLEALFSSPYTSGPLSGLEITLSHESTILGTGGGIRALYDALIRDESERSEPSCELLCVNGDALFDFALAPLIEAHRRPGERKAVGTLALREVPPGDPFGRVGVDAEGRVVRIAEVEGPRSADEVRVGAFTGAQIVTPEVIALLKPEFSDVFRVAHRALLDRDAEIRAHFVPHDSLWVDVGNIERYLSAHRALLERPESSLWEHIPPHERRGEDIIFEGASIGSGVALGGGVWVGADSSIQREHYTEGDRGGDREEDPHKSSVKLSQSVIWPDAELFLRAGDHSSVIASTADSVTEVVTGAVTEALTEALTRTTTKV